MITFETLTVNQDFMTLDLLLWRRFGSEITGRVESTLKANQDLARLGPYLPVGTRVEVEVLPPPSLIPVKVLRLWE